MSRNVVLAMAIQLILVDTATAQQASDANSTDTSGKGAILCAYEIYLSVQTATRMCEWERTASDDAIDRGLAATEAFITQNATDPWTPKFVENLKKRETESPTWSDDDAARACKRDLGNRGSSVEFIYMLRTRPPAEIDASFTDMLSIPREPVLNPCL